MVYNKITLSFPDAEEILFGEEYFKNSIVQFRIAFVLVIFLYAVFGYLDNIVVPEYVDVFHAIRYYVVVPFLTLVLILSFFSFFQKIWQILLFISFIIGGVGISVMTLLVPDNYAYYAGLLLVFFAGYFFIRLRFFWATIAGWTVFAFYCLGAIFYTETTTYILWNNYFFFGSANLIGMFAAYNIELYARRNFSLNQTVEKEKLNIININKNLEKVVEERTLEFLNAKEKAEESDRLKSAFLANMSHEIRTPMNGILGFANLLNEADLTGEEQQEYISIIQKSGKRMLNIINDIIDISKIEAGIFDLYIQETNVNDVIEEVYMFFKPETDTKGLNFSYNVALPHSQASTKTDKDKLFAVISNLVKNAVKFTKSGFVEFGYRLKERVPNAELEFFVKDTGLGIPQNRQEAIFDRFIQADIADKSAHQGSGLGLAISKAYITILNGDIWLESEEGKGSTFYFSIPLGVDIHDVDKKLNVDILDKNKKNLNLKILIAEDDEVSGSLLENYIKKYTREIIRARTGLETVNACKNHFDIDLILMDIKMPEMSGYEATQKIREFNRDVIIIAQTAFGLSGDREKALRAGCNDYISKPFSKAEIIGLIQKFG